MEGLKRGVGRPTLYTPETVDIILRGLAQGLPRRRAANLALVGEQTMQDWLKRYPEFRVQVERAEATDLSEAMLRITKHAPTEFRRLQSRYPHDLPMPKQSVQLDATIITSYEVDIIDDEEDPPEDTAPAAPEGDSE